jgi:hypothetical protein
MQVGTAHEALLKGPCPAVHNRLFKVAVNVFRVLKHGDMEILQP